MKRTIAIASLVVGAGFATTAWADSLNIKGSYAFTGTAACLVAPGGTNGATPQPNPTPGVALPNSGFKPNLQPNDSGPGLSTNAYTHSYSVEGIRTFDGHGNGTVSGTVVSITGRPTPGPNGFPHFPPSASAANFSFNFTYVVNGDGSWTGTMVPGSYLETFTAGPRAGQTATVDAIPPVTGVISNNGKTLIAAHLAPVPETHTFSNGDVDPQICHRSRVFIKIQDSDDDHDHDRDH